MLENQVSQRHNLIQVGEHRLMHQERRKKRKPKAKYVSSNPQYKEQAMVYFMAVSVNHVSLRGCRDIVHKKGVKSIIR